MGGCFYTLRPSTLEHAALRDHDHETVDATDRGGRPWHVVASDSHTEQRRVASSVPNPP